MSKVEFQGFPKIPRLFREVVITEKIDGTNGAIGITVDGVYAQSRNRVISPSADNHGFAKWVNENAYTLVADLGPGLHFGEWWGQGIGRNYGLDHKRFSLFNVKRWEENELEFGTPGLGVVPVLDRGEMATLMVKVSLERLRIGGSWAAPGFMNPEGVVVFHTAGNFLFKATLSGDEMPKEQMKQQLGAEALKRAEFRAASYQPRHLQMELGLAA